MMFAKQVEKLQSRKGIGLLELMLALAIIAILIIMATRYYQSASRSQKVADAVTQVNAVISAAANWRIGQAGYTDMDMTKLAAQGLLPKEMGDGTGGVNPWGGTITVTPVSAGEYQVIFGNVDEQDCTALISRFGSATGTSNITVTYTNPTCTFDYKEKQT